MAKYRFPCPKCGHVAMVSEDQAGASLHCAGCGAATTLPTLMQIRRLEPADDVRGSGGRDAMRIERERSRRGWGAGLFTIGLLLALIGGVGALAFWYVRSTIELVDIDPSLLGDFYQEARDLPAPDAFQEWLRVRDVELSAHPRVKPPHIQNREQHATMGTAITVALVVFAVGVVCLAAGGWSLLGPELRKRDA
jgi:hypothetical protein